MEPQQPQPLRSHHHISLLPASSISSPSSPQPSSPHVSGVTPVSSPGIFSPAASLPHGPSTPAGIPMPDSANPTPPTLSHSNSYQLPQLPVRETHIANVDRDFATGRKTINEYQVLEEIGRGQHGKVKLARDNLDGRMVAIKIIPRLSKTRRLGKVSAIDPQQNTKREIAILKKIRHENVVALLEVIDDPELQKIYMILEHVERGEVTWRKKGLPNICYFERYRFEKGMNGQELAPGEYNWHTVLDRKATIRALKEARAAGRPPPVNEWTTLYGVTADDEDDQPPWWYVPSVGLGPDASLLDSRPVSRVTSRAPSRVASSVSVTSGAFTPHSYSSEASPLSIMAQDGDTGSETPGLLHASQSAAALDGSMFGAYVDDSIRPRQRSPSIADSIMSHLSGLDFNSMVHDPYADDFSYVPCFSIEQARDAFRDTVLGLEYLHYHGVVHRDIKPANLLWTRSFHVKISDFGVSYFGRPIRDGEPDPTISEAEAKNFDDDRELSKTVGTPAFFAPELCYTDIDKEPPRVSEQIDVWSLGVTLYCLLFARIPFLAEDEFSMFRKIATEDAFISNRRLKPVGVYTDPSGSSLYQRVNVHPYRSDADPEYEELSESLLDLLRRMLIKNPDKRIRLRDVKRHKWVTEDIDDVPEWLESTDPARSEERRIQVDEAEIGGAVVPLNFLQRARSAVKRAVGKVIHPRDRDDSAAASITRSRAPSSAASSIAENPQLVAGAAAAAVAATATGFPMRPPAVQHSHSAGNNDNNHGHAFGYLHNLSQGHMHPRDTRQKSVRGDDYFATVTQLQTSEHPLAQSVTVSPYASPGENVENTPVSESAQQLMPPDESSAAIPQLEMPAMPSAVYSVDGSGDGSLSRPIRNRHVHSRSITNAILSRASILREIHTVPTSPATVDASTVPYPNLIRRTREVRATSDANARTRSVDRAGIVFANPDKRAGPVVGLSATSVSGSVQQPISPMHRASSSRLAQVDTTSEATKTSGSDETVNVNTVAPLALAAEVSSPRPLSAADVTQNQPQNQPSSYHVLPLLEERPTTAHRVQDVVSTEAGTASGRNSVDSTSALVEAPQQRRYHRGDLTTNALCPTSPRQLGFTLDGHQEPKPEEPQQYQELEEPEELKLADAAEIRTANDTPSATPTANSSSSVSLEGYNHTPLTSPSEMTHHSFVASHPGHRKSSSNAMTTFQSDPSLPALLSGASSVSADIEGDFLGSPGVVGDPSFDSATTDSLTPPALEKDAADISLDQNQEQEQGLKDQQGWASGGAIPVELDSSGSSNKTTARTPIATPIRGNSRNFTDEDNDSDSDGGIIMMAKVKKKNTAFSRESTPLSSHGGRAQTHMARRRDTNTSIGSTDTAKKVSVNTEN